MCVISCQRDTIGATGNSGWQVHQGSGIQTVLHQEAACVGPCSPEMLCCLCLREGLCLPVSLVGVLRPAELAVHSTKESYHTDHAAYLPAGMPWLARSSQPCSRPGPVSSTAMTALAAVWTGQCRCPGSHTTAQKLAAC